jgi:S1-C subfamily serine protease
MAAELAQLHGFGRGDEGLIVDHIDPGGVAEAVGIERGTLLVSVNGLRVYTADSLEGMLRHAAAGSSRPISLDIKLPNTPGTSKLAIPSEPFRTLLEAPD